MCIWAMRLFFDFFLFYLGRNLQICLVGQMDNAVGGIGFSSFNFVNDLSIL